MRTSHARHLDEIEFALRELVAEFDPDAVAPCDARRWFQAADRIERLAAALKTLLAPRVAESDAWKQKGFRSAAEQLAADAGTSVSGGEVDVGDFTSGCGAAEDGAGVAGG